MKKLLISLAVAATLLVTAFLFGLNRGIRWNLIDVYITNGSNRTIMTATLHHVQGSSIAANIKKSRKERIRFYTTGQTSYSMQITFDDNITLYTDNNRTVKNGDIVTETVTDSAITASIRN